MERVESRLRNPHRRSGRSHIPLYVLHPRQRLGYRRRDSLFIRHAHVVHRLDGLPCSFGLEQVERAAATVGSRRHLLAYCRQLFAYHAHRAARPGVLGLESVRLYLALRLGRNGHELCPSQRSQQFRDVLFRGHGTERTRRFQTFGRLACHSRPHLDYSRRRLLHHRRRVLQPQQAQIHAHRIPFLRPRGQHLPYHRRVEDIDGSVVFKLIVGKQQGYDPQ